MPTAPINGATLHYRDKGAGPVVVLLHGFPLNHAMWDAQVDALAGHYRLIAPDFRGFGHSTNPTGPFTIAQLADDVHALAQHLKLGKFVLGGLSMGGYVALAYALAYPQTLRGLMLVDTKAQADTAEAKDTRDRMIDIARRKGAAAIAQAMLAKLIPESAASARPQLVRDLEAMMESTDPDTIAHALAGMRDRPDYVESLGSIDVPTLVLGGELDAITPPDVMATLHERIPRAVHRTVPVAGHMSPMEQPQLVTLAIEQFLRDL